MASNTRYFSFSFSIFFFNLKLFNKKKRNKRPLRRSSIVETAHTVECGYYIMYNRRASIMAFYFIAPNKPKNVDKRLGFIFFELQLSNEIT